MARARRLIVGLAAAALVSSGLGLAVGEGTAQLIPVSRCPQTTVVGAHHSIGAPGNNHVPADRQSHHRSIELGLECLPHLLLPVAGDGQCLQHDLGRRQSRHRSLHLRLVFIATRGRSSEIAG